MNTAREVIRTFVENSFNSKIHHVVSLPCLMVIPAQHLAAFKGIES